MGSGIYGKRNLPPSDSHTSPCLHTVWENSSAQACFVLESSPRTPVKRAGFSD